MVHRGTDLYFKLLAILAIGLLWGLFAVNGGVRALLHAAWHGRFSDGTPLRTVYFGFPPLDFLISSLVAFFFYGTNGDDEGYHLFLLDAYSALQPAFVWLYVEAARPGPKPYWVERPLIFGILWQCFGAAIALPLYFALHLPWATSRSAVCVHDSDQAFAITSSFLLGAILPALAGMGAPWSGAPGRTALAHQLILGIWQPDPIWVCGIQMAISWISRVVRSPSYKEDLQADRRAYDWIRNAYFFASMVSGFGHLYTVRRCLTDNTDEINFTRMYVPWPFKSLSGGDENVLIYGTWLFLQYDFLIISLSSLSWAYFLLRANTSLGRAMSATTLATVLFLAAVIVGPGTTVSLALWYRETELRKVPKARLN